MNQALELHDTTLKEIVIEGSETTLCLSSAIVHKSDGIPGLDSGTCWVQKINIELEEAILEKIPEDIPNEIDFGYFIINGEKYINVIDLPINESGEIEVVAETMYGNELHLKGKRITTVEVGEIIFLQNFEGLKNKKITELPH